MLEQIRMRAGTVEGNFSGGFIYNVDKQPVRRNMTFKHSLVIAMQRVVLAFRRKGLFINDHGHYINKFSHIFAAFFGKGKFLFEYAGSIGCKHQLAPQVCQQFLNRIKMLTGNLPPHHCHAFFNGGNSLGIIARVSGYRVAVFGTDGAIAFRVRRGPGVRRFRRSKCQYNLPRRYLRGNFKSYPPVGRYVYSLRYGHEVNIA
jgi:hypothetical protein